METIPRNDFDTRNRYDAFCKAVLRNEAKNYLSEMARHRDREKSLEALTHALGGADEHAESAGGGSFISRTNLHINFVI